MALSVVAPEPLSGLTIATTRVVAIEFQTIAAANNYWR
jgi:Hexameric tyrosine-coordinated heme protein (HTHP)